MDGKPMLVVIRNMSTTEIALNLTGSSERAPDDDGHPTTGDEDDQDKTGVTELT